ncbi:unnamed protein product [Chrysoparadoxa australica]
MEADDTLVLHERDATPLSFPSPRIDTLSDGVEATLDEYNSLMIQHGGTDAGWACHGEGGQEEGDVALEGGPAKRLFKVVDLKPYWRSVMLHDCFSLPYAWVVWVQVEGRLYPARVTNQLQLVASILREALQQHYHRMGKDIGGEHWYVLMRGRLVCGKVEELSTDYTERDLDFEGSPELTDHAAACLHHGEVLVAVKQESRGGTPAMRCVAGHPQGRSSLGSLPAVPEGPEMTEQSEATEMPPVPESEDTLCNGNGSGSGREERVAQGSYFSMTSNSVGSADGLVEDVQRSNSNSNSNTNIQNVQMEGQSPSEAEAQSRLRGYHLTAMFDPSGLTQAPRRSKLLVDGGRVRICDGAHAAGHATSREVQGWGYTQVEGWVIGKKALAFLVRGSWPYVLGCEDPDGLALNLSDCIGRWVRERRMSLTTNHARSASASPTTSRSRKYSFSSTSLGNIPEANSEEGPEEEIFFAMKLWDELGDIPLQVGLAFTPHQVRILERNGIDLGGEVACIPHTSLAASSVRGRQVILEHFNAATGKYSITAFETESLTDALGCETAISQMLPVSNSNASRSLKLTIDST